MRRPAAAFAVGLTIAGAGFAGSQAWAKISAPTATSTINACVKTQNGQVRIVAAGTTCLASETATSWNVVGPTGPRGLQGPQGDRGLQGIRGIQGIQGIQGLTGLQGERGLPGDPGLPGLQGDKGDPGLPGERGLPGLQGDRGDLGPAGTNGTNGTDGALGPAGPIGLTGPQGLVGPQGPAGSGSGFTGSFKSPNGLYSLSVTNTGITLDGPGGKVIIDRSLVRVIGEPWVSIEGQGR